MEEGEEEDEGGDGVLKRYSGIMGLGVGWG